MVGDKRWQRAGIGRGGAEAGAGGGSAGAVCRHGGLREVASYGGGGAGSGLSVVAAVGSGCPAGGVPSSSWQAGHLRWWCTGLGGPACHLALVWGDAATVLCYL